MDTPQHSHLYPYWTEALSAHHYGTCKAYGREEYDKLFDGFETSHATSRVPLWGKISSTLTSSAKIILTTRPVDEWVAAMAHTIDDFRARSKNSIWEFVSDLDLVSGRRSWWQHQKFQLGLRQHLCPRGERLAYVEHCAAVREYVDSERLLEFELGMGWEKLCAFLGAEVPEEDFPVKGEEEAERQVR
jgi:hypothetical protein